MCGTITHEVTAPEFNVLVRDGFARLAKRDRRLAHLKERYRAHIEFDSKLLRIQLAEPPQPDPAGVPSWWPLLVERKAFFLPAKADFTLMAWACQMENIRVPAELLE